MLGLDKLSNTLNDFVNSITGEGKEILDSRKIEKMDEKYAKERHSLLGEVAESAVARRLPWWGKVADLFTSLGIKKGDPEAVRRQKEFESITAWTMFVPDALLKYVTTPITKIPGFKKLLKNYPLGAKPKRRLLDDSGKLLSNPNPDDVVDFLRMVNQDIISGKVFVSKIS